MRLEDSPRNFPRGGRAPVPWRESLQTDVGKTARRHRAAGEMQKEEG
jgi:hypothetical protein